MKESTTLRCAICVFFWRGGLLSVFPLLPPLTPRSPCFSLAIRGTYSLPQYKNSLLTSSYLAFNVVSLHMTMRSVLAGHASLLRLNISRIRRFTRFLSTARFTNFLGTLIPMRVQSTSFRPSLLQYFMRMSLPLKLLPCWFMTR